MTAAASVIIHWTAPEVQLWLFLYKLYPIVLVGNNISCRTGEHHAEAMTIDTYVNIGFADSHGRAPSQSLCRHSQNTIPCQPFLDTAFCFNFGHSLAKGYLMANWCPAFLLL